MISVLRAEDVRRQDAEAAARGIPVETLMENAGYGVAWTARRILRGAYGKRVVILVGKGNNGGDGLVAGRWLTRWGAHCTAVITAPPSKMSGLAVRQLDRFGGRVVAPERLPRELGRAHLVIDAIFGVGLARAPEGEAAEVIRICREHRHAGSVGDGPANRVAVIAVDVPSGVEADTGRTFGEEAAVEADVTVTLGGYKPGLWFEPGARLAGRVVVADIGLGVSDPRAPAFALEAGDVVPLLPTRAHGSHKRSVGTVLVIAGSRAMPGAAALACGAAVHGGAGLTVLCAPEEVCQVVLARVPEITTIPAPTTGDGTIDPKAWEVVRPRLDEFGAIAIGPGMTTHPATVELIRQVVAEARQPVVLDADAINAFAGTAELLGARGAPTVVTPHGGELARLLDRPAADLEADRLGTAIGAARDLQAVVVLKGPGTVVSDGTLTSVNPTGGRALAQGGTGDVLTGLLGAMVASWWRAGHAPTPGRFVGPPLASVAAAGVWLHGRAADRLAERLAPHPANASALVEELGPTMHEVASA